MRAERHRSIRRSLVAVSTLLLVITLTPWAGADELYEGDVPGGVDVQLLTDPVHGLELTASTDVSVASAANPDLEIFDAAGSSVGTYATDGVGGLAISDDGSVLFATKPNEPAIRRLDLTDVPPTELADLAITDVFQPHSVVFAGGALWVAQCLDDSTVEKVDPTTGEETAQDITGLDISRCPQFVDHPTLANVFYAWGRFQGTLQRFDVSSGSLVATASWPIPGGGAISDVAVAPGGGTLIAAVSFASPSPGAVVLDPTTLVATGTRYRDGTNLSGVSIAADGHVAVGFGTTVEVFASGGASPTATWSSAAPCRVRQITYRGVDFGPSDDVLFVKDQEGPSVAMLSNPTSTLATSTISVSAEPNPGAPGDPVVLSGALDVGGAADSGRTVELFHSGVSIDSTTTTTGGAFSFDVAPPTAGAQCFDVRFEGISTATGAWSSVTVDVLKIPSSVVINGPLTAYPSESIEFSGTLAFDDDASAEGEIVHVGRSQDGFTFTPADDAVVEADGTWSITTNAPAVGTWIYRAAYDGTDRYANDLETTQLQVERRPTNLTIGASREQLIFGQSVTLTARLDLLPGTTKRGVAFRFEPLNGPAVAFGKVPANDNGVARFTVRATAIGNYFARYAGDARNVPDEAQVHVITKARIVTRMGGHYGVSGAYRLFHTGAVPRYGVGVLPERRWSVHFVLQRLRDGAWRTRAQTSFTTNRNGIVLVLIDPRFLPLGARFRIRASVDSTGTSFGKVAGNVSRFTYFRITR